MFRASLVLIVFALIPGASFARQRNTAPLPPSVVAPPLWTKSIQMPDGRIFITDGALAIDTKVARPAAMPATVLPVSTGAVIDRQLKAAFTDEASLATLRTGTQANTFVGPRGITVSGNYVTFLRKVAPASRLRFAGASQAIVIALGGQAIGLVMPTASAP
jgi:hypothetical protein